MKENQMYLPAASTAILVDIAWVEALRLVWVKLS